MPWQVAQLAANSLPPSSTSLALIGGGVGLGLVDGGGNGVQPTRDQEAHQQQRNCCQWVTSLLRECLHVVVPLFDPAVAPGAAS